MAHLELQFSPAIPRQTVERSRMPTENKTDRPDRCHRIVQRRRSSGASYSSVSSRYFHRVESICRFHRHRPSQCVPRTDFKGNRIRGVRKLLPKRLSLCTGNVLTSSRKTALLSRHHFSRESYVVRPWSPQTAHRRSRSSTDRLPGSRVKFRYLLPLTGVQLGLADSRVSSCIKRQIDSRTDDRSPILSKALINPGHSGGLLRVFSITCLICLLLVFPLFFRLSQAKC